MPVINRIRIANINYDGKYIADELIDTFDGENTLLNLKNGSGKSVLVQLIMQPIIPGVSIHGRKVEGYLQQNRPSVIALEWKLDNTPVPTYFLTALVIRLSAPNEKNTSRVNYFTFVNRYAEAREFDITDLPFISHNNNVISIQPYSDCRSIVKNSAVPNSPLNYFSSDDDSEYRAKLEQNGIFPDEWRLIARCNEEEGGISKMLEKIKTSDALFDEWILKTVTGGSSNSSLIEMFKALIECISDNDENIRCKEVIENFLRDSDGYVENLEKLMEQHDLIEKQQTKIADICHFLTTSQKRAEEAVIICDEKLRRNRDAEELIKYEELSYEYHNAYERYQLACDEYGEALAAEETAKNAHTAAKHRVDLLNAVSDYNEQKKEEARENSAREKLRRTEKGDDPDRYNDLVFSLRQCYSERTEDLRVKEADVKRERDEIERKISDLKKEKDGIDKLNNELSKKIGSLQSAVENFQSYEKALLKELEISPVYTLDDELEKESLNSIRKSFLLEKSRLESDLKKARGDISAFKETIASLDKEKDDLNSRRTDISVKITVKEQEKKEYETAEEKALAALRSFGIGETRLFDKDAVKAEMRTAERAKDKKLSEYQVAFQRKEKYLKTVKAGTVHISRELSDELKKHGIDFTTGEEYLLGEPDERRTQLLSKDPMLPFCYIVDEKNLALIRKTDLGGHADKAVPIITFENVGRASAVSAKIAEMSENSLLLCLYNERCIDSGDRELYIKELEEELALTQENLTRLENETKALAAHEAAYCSFDYERTFSADLERELSELNRQSELIKQRLVDIPAEISECNRLIDERKETADDLGRLIAKNADNSRRFEEYAEKYPDHANNKRVLAKSEKAVERNTARAKSIEEELTDAQNGIEECRGKLRRVEDEITEIEKRVSVLDNTIVGKRLTLPLEQLEQEFRSVTENVRTVRSELEREISEARESVEKCTKRLRKSDIPFEEYSDPSLIFSDELLESAEKAEKECCGRLSACTDKVNAAAGEKNRVEGALAVKMDNLKKAKYPEPLERSQIKLCFDERRSALYEENGSLKKEEKKYQELRMECAEKAAALKGLFTDDQYSGKYIPKEVSEVAPEELNKVLNERIAQKRVLENALKDNYDKVLRKYEGCGYEAIDAFINNMRLDEKNSFDGFFEVFDHIKESQKFLEQDLEIRKNDLEMLESKKTNFVRQALAHGQSIYSEVKNISNMSRIKIDGKPRQMLVIGIPENADSRAEENMRIYLEKFLADIRAVNAIEPMASQKLMRKIENTFSDRELLNIVIGKRRIDVSLYKVDVTGNNGHIRTWEEVLVNNSGAQSFVAGFAFVCTLMEYTRNKRMEQMGAEKISSRKTFVLDNPFSATSTEEYLNVMKALSIKFNIQLICFSDLHQNSITNKFNVFYQLALRNSLYSNRAALKVMNVETNGDIHRNARLEHTMAQIKQITLFDINPIKDE